jgi:hypothetical protein
MEQREQHYAHLKNNAYLQALITAYHISIIMFEITGKKKIER